MLNSKFLKTEIDGINAYVDNYSFFKRFYSSNNAELYNKKAN